MEDQMSEISSILRGFANTYYPKGHREAYDALFAIADRIDAEMVELPKAADKKPIHMGDTLYSPDGNEHHVWFMCRHFSEQWRWMVFDVAPDLFIDHELVPLLLSHTAPDSLERIADDLEELSESNRVNGSGEVFYRAGELAARIRRLADKEGK